MAFGDKIGEIRPNQLITTFGPGAIMDAVKDSVTVLDLNYWQVTGKKIYDSRLASYLGVDYFQTPRTTHNADLPVISFPNIHICGNPKCGHIFNLRDSFDFDKYMRFGATCPKCNWRGAYPSRFITICSNGHMDDFPYSWWVHNGQTSCKSDLRLFSTGNTSTLGDMWVECLTCGVKRSLSGATQEDKFNISCTGRHPFRPKQKKKTNGTYDKCECQLIPSQRGASNVYFPVIRSAISIPPWVNPLFNLIDEHFAEIQRNVEDFGDIAIDKAFERYFQDNYTRDEFDVALERRRKNIKEYTELKEMEYNAITHFNDTLYSSNKRYFKAEEESVPEISKYISRVIRVTRLREIMVLLGFTRIDAPDPDADEQKNIVYLNKSKTDPWLPGVEINGEGVFLEFNKRTLSDWSKQKAILDISSVYKSSFEQFCKSKGWECKQTKNAEYVLMHTFAHLLIKEMSMQSGYSSASIKERIYSNERMHGILLYTGSSDKEGSLGGLVELGLSRNIKKLMKSAFENALVCTNDPECMNNIPNIDRGNGAACHSCSMVSETACENGNRMLDRSLVVPLHGKETTSYFKELVNELCQLQI